MSTLTATIIADFTTTLATALSVGGTTATLSSATDDDNVALPTGRYFFTLDGSNSSKEHISCTLTGTALTNIKTVSRQGVETAGVLRVHRIGASVSITDFAHILQINNLVKGTTALDASVPLGYDGTASITTANQLTTKTYVDSVTVAGAPNASTTVKGISETATQAEVLAKTTTGGTGALLVVTPDTLASTLLSDYKVDTGAPNAYVITPAPAITAYTTGQIFSFKAVNANTTTSTLNVNGLGVKTINKAGGATALASGDIAAGMVVLVEYDGTNFVMLNPVANVPLSTSSIVSSIYGNGADGNVTISSNTTLTSDMNYNDLTINATFTLTTAGYRVFVAGTLINNGFIDNSGIAAVTNTGGAGGLAGTMLGGSAGASTSAQGGGGGGGGGIIVLFAKTVAVQGLINAKGGAGIAAQTPTSGNLNGSNGTAASRTIIQTGTGGAGGACTSQSGGTGGTITTVSKMARGTPTLLMSMVDGILQLTGGAGGASGGSNITSITAGGGGGGQGGLIVFVYNSLTTSGTLSVIGGTFGVGFGAGSVGVAGSSGLAISIQCNA